MRWVLPLLFLLPALTLHAQATPEQLAAVLKKYPAADANKDGTLSMEEALAFRASKQKAAATPDPDRPAPTIAEGRYGESPRSVFDFWRATSAPPAPLFLYIHGGGFVGGDKGRFSPGMIKEALARGFAVMSINYPFLDGLPIQKILPTSARAVQYARHHAAEWGIDPRRIYVCGSSAGGGTALWIGSHADLADPESADPIARESTRIQGAAMINGQASYDMMRWDELIGPSEAGWQKTPTEILDFYHFTSADELNSPAGQAARRDVDMSQQVDAATPPLLLYCNTVVGPKVTREAYLHHPKHAEVIAEKARAFGVPHELIIGEKARSQNGNLLALEFFEKLSKAAGKVED
jgi:acetyl esterase